MSICAQGSLPHVQVIVALGMEVKCVLAKILILMPGAAIDVRNGQQTDLLPYPTVTVC
jgi:hypothetical protein